MLVLDGGKDKMENTKLIPYDTDIAMEVYNKYADIDLSCSIEHFDPFVPYGARDYFQRHGYVLVKNILPDFSLYAETPKNGRKKGKIEYMRDGVENSIPEEVLIKNSLVQYQNIKYQKAYEKVGVLVSDILGVDMNEYFYNTCFSFNDQSLESHFDENLDKNSLCVELQFNTNLFVSWPLFIETKNQETHIIKLENGCGVIYDGTKVKHWREPMRSRYTRLGKILNLNNDKTFCHHGTFYYLKN